VYLLFYPDGKKIIPSNLMELMTPVSLAFWAMDDGNKKESGFELYTHSFNISEVEELLKILQSKFGLNCTIQSNRGHDGPVGSMVIL
jgi:hypothetical protein